jgi:hypothetical protein
MSEAKALTLVLVTTGVFVTAVCGALMALRVQGELIAVAFFLIGGAGAYLQSRIAMHYPPPDKQRR